MTVKPGWQGRFFEDFEFGDEYRHPLGRTLTQPDNIWFTLLTQNLAAVHFDARRHGAAARALSAAHRRADIDALLNALRSSTRAELARASPA